MPETRALVLGAGGPVGRAWLAGLIGGFEARAVGLREADAIIGTSAGASTGAQLALGVDLSKPPVLQPAPPPTSQGVGLVLAALEATATSKNLENDLKVIAGKAKWVETISEEEFLARQPFITFANEAFPSNLKITAVSASTGIFQVWSAHSGVPLQRAVASSCSAVGIWPAVTLGNDYYIDGGFKSMTNASVAAGYDKVIVVSCLSLDVQPDATDVESRLSRKVVDEIEQLRKAGSTVEVIAPNDEMERLTDNGRHIMDASLAPEAFLIGQRHAASQAERIRAVWQT